MQERLSEHFNIRNVYVQPVRDDDLVIVTIPRTTSHQQIVDIQNATRDAIADTAARVGIMVVVEGTTIDVAEGASRSAHCEQRAFAERRTK